MSQPPPPFPPQGPPPTGYPHVTGEPPNSNLMAVFALITGILFCIPGAGVLATILGIAGIKKSNNPNTGGRGLAIAGLVLGIIGVLWSGMFVAAGAVGYMSWRAAGPARIVCREFSKDIASGDTASAMKLCDPSMPPETVQAAVDSAKNWGAFQSAHFPSVKMSTTADGTICDMAGTVQFAYFTKNFQATLKKAGVTYRILSFQYN